MDSITRPLREEHQELWPHIEQIREVADLTGVAATEELRRGLDEVSEFLSTHLLSHARAEEGALYPVVARLMGSSSATATMDRDHREVANLARQLELAISRMGEREADVEDMSLLRRVLYGLYALLQVHFAKEEEVYLSLLDANLTPEEATRMLEGIHAEAQKEKQATG
jgi:hemerythrin-like domain-containing protein